jgi:AcrR family transcriptional regulator
MTGSTDVSDPAAPRLRADAARKRATILAAARVMLAEQSGEIPLNRLAERSGVGVGTVYRHFPDQQTLREGLAAASLSELVGDAKAAAADPDPSSSLERLLRAGLQLQLRDPVLAEVLCGPSPVCVETLTLSSELMVSISGVIARAREAGIIEPGITADDLRRLIGGVLFAANAGSDVEQNAERYFQLMLMALRRTTTPAD